MFWYAGGRKVTVEHRRKEEEEGRKEREKKEKWERKNKKNKEEVALGSFWSVGSIPTDWGSRPREKNLPFFLTETKTKQIK